MIRRLFRNGPYALCRRALPRQIGRSARRGNRSKTPPYTPAKAPIPGVGTIGLVNMEQGGGVGGWLHQLILRANDGTLRWFVISDSIETGAELKVAVHAAGLGGLQMVHYIGDPEGRVERLIREAWPKGIVGPLPDLEAGSVIDAELREQVTSQDARAMAMIAFHMFLAFSVFRGGEAVFAPLRDAISGKSDPFGVVRAQDPDEVGEPLHRVRDERPDQQKHLLLAGTTRTHELVVDLRLFATAKHALWWRVRLAAGMPQAAHQLGVALVYTKDEITLPGGRKVDGELVPLSGEHGVLVVRRRPEPDG